MHRPSPGPASSATAAIRYSPALAALLALAACGPAAETQAPAPAAAYCRTEVFEGSRFTICPYDARTQRIELAVADDGGPLRSFEALERHLGTRVRHLRFAMNAGMYDEAGQPIGLYVEQGRRLRRVNLREGPGNFHMQPNGVFSVDGQGRVAVTTSEAFARRQPEAMWATQSGPMLVIDGRLHQRFSADGESRLIRNGVGVSDPDTAWFAISEEPVSFGRFARLFHDALGCRNALFLDGTVSSLWDPGGSRRDGGRALGPMVMVFARSP